MSHLCKTLTKILLVTIIVLGCKNNSGLDEEPIDPPDIPPGDNPISSDFVKTDGSDFILDGEIYRFAGTNAYYLPNYEKIDPDEVNNTFSIFEEAGVTVVRTWGFYDGPPQFSDDITIQPEPGVYNEEHLQDLDRIIAKGKNHGIRFIIALINYWDELGGIKQYNSWDGNPRRDLGYFINDPDTQQWYRDYINMLLKRTNTVTNIQYKDEPAIFSWEIMNEARLTNGDPNELQNWYRGIAQYIKSIDPNHLVSTGEEGFEDDMPLQYSLSEYDNSYPLEAGEGSSYILNTSIPEIDYGTAHWYPAEWGWGVFISESLMMAQRAWVTDHANIAENLGKPFLLGEYGFPGWGDERTEMVYDDIWNYAEQIQLDGSLLWQFTPTYIKCYEFGGNICYPGGRADQGLYERFTRHTNTFSD